MIKDGDIVTAVPDDEYTKEEMHIVTGPLERQKVKNNMTGNTYNICYVGKGKDAITVDESTIKPVSTNRRKNA